MRILRTSIFAMVSALVLAFAPISVPSELGVAAPFVGVQSAEAGVFCTTSSSCKATVRAEVQRQNAAARGRLWGPPSRTACDQAGSEQLANERRCRKYDNLLGQKDPVECAKCYRQVVFDLARWEQCYAKRLAPKPPAAIYASLARLGKSAE